MNITNILKTLCEASEVNKIKASVGNKVPASVMDALAKNAKQTQRGAFYDNEAMAIIKSISDGNEDPYLLANPNAVHSILKKLKKGDSSFRTDRVLKGGSGKDYWKKLYQKANEDKPELSKKERDYNETGLKTAVVKSVDDKWFAVFPKNFYDAKSEKALRLVNSEKSHEDIRRISAEIAAKDSGKDTGVANTWENNGNRNRKAEKDPRVNHWCVSASDSNYYNSYASGQIFKFIIFVKKNPDGSPNWDERYLWYYSPTRWWGDSEEGEFADKWDRHTKPSKVLSHKAMNLITSVKKGLREANGKRKDFEQAIKDTAKQKAKADIESSDKENGYDINVDDELENILKGAKRKNLTSKKEAEVILKSMPWLEEANGLKAKDLKSYFLNHATGLIQDQRWIRPLLIYTQDDYKSGVVVNPIDYAFSFLVFNNDGEPLDWSVLKHYQNDLIGLSEVTNSVVYPNNVSTYKQLLNALRAIVGVGKSKIELHKASTHRNKPLSTIHVSQYVEPKRTVMLNLSNYAQKIFDSAYREINPAEEKVDFRGKGSTTEKFFYNSKLRTLFCITYDSMDKGYKIFYKEPKGDMWRTITKINSGFSLDEAKKAVKEFQDKKLAEIEREKKLIDSVRAEMEAR